MLQESWCPLIQIHPESTEVKGIHTCRSAAPCAIRRVRILRMCLELDNDLLLVMDELATGGVSDSQKACWHTAGPENISSLLPTEGFPNLRPWPCQCKLHSAVRFLLWFVYPGAWQVYLLNDQQTEHLYGNRQTEQE